MPGIDSKFFPDRVDASVLKLAISVPKFNDICKLSDFPKPVAGVITLPSGYYFINGRVNIGTNQLKIADGATVALQAWEINFDELIYEGTDSLFIDNPATATGNIFICRFIRILLTGGGDLVDFPDGGARRNTFWLKGTFVIGASGTKMGTVQNTDFFSITDFMIASAWDDGFTISDIGQTVIVAQFKFGNNVGGTAFEIDGGNFGTLTIENCQIGMQSTESFIFINPINTYDGGLDISGNAIDDSLGGDFYRVGLTGDITAFADAGGGFTTVTSTAHGLSNGDTVLIDLTTNYNNGHNVSSVTANTFDIDTAFVADDGVGRFNSGSVDERNPNVTVKGNSRIPDSTATTFITMIENSTVTVIAASNTPVKLAGTFGERVTAVQRFENDTTGRATYIGLEDRILFCLASFRVNAQAGANNPFQFCFVRGNLVSNAITAYADAGGGATTVTTDTRNLPDLDFSVTQRVNINNSTNYNGVHAISNVTLTTFDIDTAFVADDAAGDWGELIFDSTSRDTFDNNDLRNIPIQGSFEFQTDDYLEIFAEDTASTVNLVADTLKFNILE